MRVLWTMPQATVVAVRAALRGRPRIAYNSVLTTLRILERKGYVGHHRDGRAFVFRARVSLEATRRRALHHLIARFFDDSPAYFAERLIGDAYLTRAVIVQATRRLAVGSVT